MLRSTLSSSINAHITLNLVPITFGLQQDHGEDREEHYGQGFD
jgi:hypothetical protein